jgi:hypothetical protein
VFGVSGLNVSGAPRPELGRGGLDPLLARVCDARARAAFVVSRVWMLRRFVFTTAIDRGVRAPRQRGVLRSV